MSVKPKRIKVVVVDDSALIRNLLTAIINEDPTLEVVATAADPIAARERIRETNPDVITLDVEMPKMDGIEFLRRLMRLRPTPVIMISTLTEQGSEIALEALSLGAVDVVAKPKIDVMQTLDSYASEIRAKIHVAASSKPRLSSTPLVTVQAKVTELPKFKLQPIICIGSSTGGTEALKDVLLNLPKNMPPILIAQHMPEMFTYTFAQRLNNQCDLKVKEAEHDELIMPGVVYIAPGHSHLRVASVGGRLRTRLGQDEPINRHRPSVEALFDSVVPLGVRAVGIMLTGMGKDGAQALLRMHNAGAKTFGQDQDSCVVYGMPREAAIIGAIDEVLPLNKIAKRLVEYLVQGH